MEIYNEDINDLLAPEHRKLQIHESTEVLKISVSWRLCVCYIAKIVASYLFLFCVRREEYM
jgi:hypothetical protein